MKSIDSSKLRLNPLPEPQNLSVKHYQTHIATMLSNERTKFQIHYDPQFEPKRLASYQFFEVRYLVAFF